MAQNLGQLTDQWMVNPTMFDPTQASNQFSNYNNAALPWPPSYNTGAGGPVNAATGQPIQSFQDWQKANPAGMSINSTPATPTAQPGLNSTQQWWNNLSQPSALNPSGNAQFGMNEWGAFMGPQGAIDRASPGFLQPGMQGYQGQAGSPGGAGGATQGAVGGAQQGGAAPNNWQAALNALANPGKVTTPGATVPMVTGSQPAGGVNQAFLQNAGQGQGMNQNFLSALRAIQNR